MSNHLLSSTSYQPPAIKLNTNPQLQRTPPRLLRGLRFSQRHGGWSLRAPERCAAISLLAAGLLRQSGYCAAVKWCLRLSRLTALTLQWRCGHRDCFVASAPRNDEWGIRLAKTVEEYIFQDSEFFCSEDSSCPVSKTFVP
jgi:hypothetical protein